MTLKFLILKIILKVPPFTPSPFAPRFASNLPASVVLVITLPLFWSLAASVSAEDLWIFDVHSHSSRDLDLEDIIRHMDASGVRKIVLFARRGGKDEDILGLHMRYPERVVPAVGFQNPGWLRQNPGFLDDVESKLKTGKFRWMGELLLRHYGVPELQAPEFDIPPETPLFQKVLALSARYGVPVTIHHEADPHNIDNFRRALRPNPDALVVWAHWCGRAAPEVVRSFLGEFSSLYCDLGASQWSRRYGREKNPLLSPAGLIRPEWKVIIEAFPNRFLAAIDAVESTHYRQYQKWVAELKYALTGLPSAIGRQVSFENSERLLSLRKKQNR